jgi:molybdopterin synthase catalytic subunit
MDALFHGAVERSCDTSKTMLVDLRDTPLSLDDALASIAHAGSGGLAFFVGIVRDKNDGHAVTKLEYTAYGAMAKAEMERIAKEVELDIPGTRAAILHRVGTLAIGDAAVICAASAPHRDEAFRACRELIERLKLRVPIWKKETGPEGETWVGWRP